VGSSEETTERNGKREEKAGAGGALVSLIPECGL